MWSFFRGNASRRRNSAPPEPGGASNGGAALDEQGSVPRGASEVSPTNHRSVERSGSLGRLTRRRASSADPSGEQDGQSSADLGATERAGRMADKALALARCVANHYEVKFLERDADDTEETTAVCIAPILGSLDCPITREVMQEPVMTCDGHLYDRPAIECWFRQGRRTSPLTNLELSSLTCTPVAPFLQAVEAFINARPEVLGICRQLREQQQSHCSTVDSMHKEMNRVRQLLSAATREVDHLRKQLKRLQHEQTHNQAEPATAQQRSCTCANALEPKDRFCGKCGSKVVAAQVASGGVRTNTETALARPLPPELGEVSRQLAHDTSRPSGKENRQERGTAKSQNDTSCQPRGSTSPERRKPRRASGERPCVKVSKAVDCWPDNIGQPQRSEAPSLLTSRSARVPGPPERIARGSSRGLSANRQELIRAVFRLLDDNRTSRLHRVQLRRFARVCHVVGNGVGWSTKFQEFDAETGCSEEISMNLEEFMHMMSDRGSKCTDKDLALVRKALKSGIVWDACDIGAHSVAHGAEIHV